MQFEIALLKCICEWKNKFEIGQGNDNLEDSKEFKLRSDKKAREMARAGYKANKRGAGMFNC